MENTETQRILRAYYEQLYANKMDNLEEMEKFFEKYSFQRLNQEEIENMNKPIKIVEIKIVIKRLPTSKSIGPDGFTDKFYQILRANTHSSQTLAKSCRGKNTP